MKKIVTLVVVVLLITVGCSSVKKKSDTTLGFELDTVFGIKKDETEQIRSDYSTHMVQDGKLLASKNETNLDYATEIVTKELFLVDLNTQEQLLLKQFDHDIRVWDYVLIEDGFLYSTVEFIYYDHTQTSVLEFKVIENIAGVEKVLDKGTIFNPFTTPSFHFIDNVIYYGMQAIQYVDNAPTSMLIDIVRYENGKKENIFSIENSMTSTYYMDHGTEKLLTTELSKGDSSIGFFTHILGENQSNVYIADKTGAYTKTTVEGLVTDLMVFENRTIYQLITLTENEEVESVDYFDLKNSKPITWEGYNDFVGRVVSMDENTLGFIGEGDPYLIHSDKKALKVYKVDYDEFNDAELPFIYPVGPDKLLIVQYPDEFPLQLSLIKIKEIPVDQ